jgi:hypothetical protein
VCALVREDSHAEGKAVKVHQLDKGGGRSRKSIVSTGGGSKSRVRSSSSSAKKGLKWKLQFQEGVGEAAPSDSKQVWGGAAKGRSARSAGGRGIKLVIRPRALRCPL